MGRDVVAAICRADGRAFTTAPASDVSRQVAAAA
jgi:hypothetical protein